MVSFLLIAFEDARVQHHFHRSPLNVGTKHRSTRIQVQNLFSPFDFGICFFKADTYAQGERREEIVLKKSFNPPNPVRLKRRSKTVGLRSKSKDCHRIFF